MKTLKQFSLLALCALLMLSLCGCASSRQTDGQSYREEVSYYSDYSTYDYNAEAVAEEAYGGLAPTAMYSSTTSNSNAKTASSGTGSGNTENGGTETDLNPEKIIYSADATVETTAFDETVTALDAMIETYGGWVESSSVNGAKYSSISRGSKTNRSASYTIRVPNDRFTAMMNELSSLGNVPYSHVYTENVTAQYYDTQARLKTYEAQEQRLLELLDKAETVSDVIEIENELTDVRYRIESLQTSLRSWDRRVSWSTIHLTVNEVSEYTPVKARTYGEKLSDALSTGLDTLAELFVDFVEALPVLLFALVLIFVVLFILLRLIRRVFRSPKREERRAKKEAEKTAKEAAEAAKKEKE